MGCKSISLYIAYFVGKGFVVVDVDFLVVDLVVVHYVVDFVVVADYCRCIGFAAGWGFGYFVITAVGSAVSVD